MLPLTLLEKRLRFYVHRKNLKQALFRNENHKMNDHMELRDLYKGVLGLKDPGEGKSL